MRNLETLKKSIMLLLSIDFLDPENIKVEVLPDDTCLITVQIPESVDFVADIPLMRATRLRGWTTLTFKHDILHN